eukprot:scaffold131119_cov34-Tisochrysis_lutea.AAC.3
MAKSQEQSASSKRKPSACGLSRYSLSHGKTCLSMSMYYTGSEAVGTMSCFMWAKQETLPPRREGGRCDNKICLGGKVTRFIEGLGKQQERCMQ